MAIILSLGRKLPRPLRKILVGLYRRWNDLNVKIDWEIIRDLAEYSNLKEKDVIWLAKRAMKMNAFFWQMLNPKTEEEIDYFYQTTPFYIFELAWWHMKRNQRKFRSEIIELAQGQVLDFGAGIGDFCLLLEKKGLKVDYADVGGRTFEFAQWLFKKRNSQIQAIDLRKEKISKQYDSIYCLDVIEHLPDPKKSLTELAACLRKGGRLVITNLGKIKSSERNPMHLEKNIDLEKHLKSLGLFEGGKPWIWEKL